MGKPNEAQVLLSFLVALAILSRCYALPTEEAARPPLQPRAATQPDTETRPASFFKLYLRNPSDFTTILLIIGGDIVQKALAQLCGSRRGAPVAFSFGWVSYSFSALTSMIGDGRLMPEPEIQSLVANSNSGYVRQNGSWTLGRLLRDLERKAPHGKGGLIWFIGFFVIPLQLLIAIIPWILQGNWSIFLLTLSGTLLALLGSTMPQWAAEKWGCRKRGGGCYSLMRGNGHRHVFVIKNMSDDGLNLEDLAASHVQLSSLSESLSRTLFAVMAALWLVFLICAGSLETDIWYLLGVGLLGMVQNILVAGATRSPAAYGFDLRQQDIIQGVKTMPTLKQLEERYAGIGLSLLNVFFPGDLWPEEERYWNVKRVAKQLRRTQTLVPAPSSAANTAAASLATKSDDETYAQPSPQSSEIIGPQEHQE